MPSEAVKFEILMEKEMRRLLTQWNEESLRRKIPLEMYKRMLKDRADEIMDERNML